MKRAVWLAALSAALGGCASVPETNPYSTLQQAVREHRAEDALTLVKQHPRQFSTSDALILAAEVGDIPAAERFIAKRAWVNAQNQEGLSPLMMAAKTGQVTMVEFLINRGADFDLRDARGCSALDYAASWVPSHAFVASQKHIIARYLSGLGRPDGRSIVQLAQLDASLQRSIWEPQAKVIDTEAPPYQATRYCY